MFRTILNYPAKFAIAALATLAVTTPAPAQDLTKILEKRCAEGQAANDYPSWEFIANNAVRTADEYAVNRNPNATFVKATYWLGGFFWKTGDKRIIDGLGPDGVTSLVRWGSRRLSAMHTGYLYHYAFVIIGAALVFGAVIFWRVGGAG